jgi:putative transposase
MAEAMIEPGIPEYIRPDNGPEFVDKGLRKWLAQTGTATLHIEPGSPWENGYGDGFNSKLRDAFLNGEIFDSLKEVRVLTERWRIYYKTVRPQSSLGYRPPAPQTRQLEQDAGRGIVESAAHLPRPRRRLSNYFSNCATLTIALAQKIGHTSEPHSISTLLTRNLHDVSCENNPRVDARRLTRFTPTFACAYLSICAGITVLHSA